MRKMKKIGFLMAVVSGMMLTGCMGNGVETDAERIGLRGDVAMTENVVSWGELENEVMEEMSLEGVTLDRFCFDENGESDEVRRLDAVRNSLGYTVERDSLGREKVLYYGSSDEKIVICKYLYFNDDVGVTCKSVWIV